MKGVRSSGGAGSAAAPPTSRARRAAVSIVRTLRDAGHAALLAGGCVRDELLGSSPQDYDVATDATPERVAELFPKTRAVGKAFGVTLVRAGGATTEVATFREEWGYSDARRPDGVRFCGPEDDARRRDFTVNALFVDPLDVSARPGGRVIDYVGGEADLRAGLIRAVGDAEQRLAEDHLRALRGVRFAARLGFELESATASAIAARAGALSGVSRERVGDETRKMLGHRSRGRAVALMTELGLDGPVLGGPGLGEASGPEGSGGPRPGVVVGAIGADAGPWGALDAASVCAAALAGWAVERHGAGHCLSPGAALRGMESSARGVVRAWRRSLCLTNDECALVLGTLELASRATGGGGRSWGSWSRAKRRRASASASFGAAVALISAIEPREAGAIAGDARDLAALPGGLLPQPLIDGDDLIREGFEPGPMFRRWLDAVYDAQLDGSLADRESAISMIRQMSAAGRG